MTYSPVWGIKMWVYLGVIMLPTTSVPGGTVGSDYFCPKMRLLYGQCLLYAPTRVARTFSELHCMVRTVQLAFLPPWSLSELSHRQFTEIFLNLLLRPLPCTGVTSYKSLVLLNPLWWLLHKRPKLAPVLKRFQTKMKQCVSSLKEDVSSWLR